MFTLGDYSCALLNISIINFHEGFGPLGATWAEKNPLFEDGHCGAMHSTNGKHSQKRLVLIFFLLFEAILARNSRTFGCLAPRRLSCTQGLGLSKSLLLYWSICCSLVSGAAYCAARLRPGGVCPSTAKRRLWLCFALVGQYRRRSLVRLRLCRDDEFITIDQVKEEAQCCWSSTAPCNCFSARVQDSPMA